ncbi:MAG TPA: nuclear transport factor 2 family protein [Solirubrobacteraceae bacterium]
MQGTNLELARRGYEAALRGEFDVLSDLLDPDVKWHGGDPDGPGACRNRDQALQFMDEARRRRGVGELVELIGAGDKVVVVMRPAGDGPPGELVANVTTFRDGKVVEMVHYADPDEARAAVGI